MIVKKKNNRLLMQVRTTPRRGKKQKQPRQNSNDPRQNLPENKCDWAIDGRCLMHPLATITCSRTGCTTQIHHACQNQWEFKYDEEPAEMMKVCRAHHPNYARHTAAITAAANIAAAAAKRKTQLVSTPTLNLPAAEVSFLNENNPSPADSSLTGQPTMPPLPPLIGFEDGMLEPTAAITTAANATTLAANTDDKTAVVATNANTTQPTQHSDDEDSYDEDIFAGDDSDEEGDEVGLFVHAEEHDENELDDEEEVFGSEAETTPAITLPGSPPGWFPPMPPIGFQYQPKWNAPASWEEVDNPGGWSPYTFQARYDKKAYTCHYTPTGAQVLPTAAGGARSINGWEFHYNGWTPNDEMKATYSRQGALAGDLKPLSRKGCLDVNILKKHGLTADRVKGDPLFFFNLLFPFGSPSASGIEDDHRMPYFSNVAICTNIYACMKGGGIGLGHSWSPVSVMEMVHWTAVPIRHGALEGNPGTLLLRWKIGDARADHLIYDNMTKGRWEQIKRYFKLNVNYEEASKGKEGYDPCAKYDFIFKCLIHNMNYCTSKADLDITIDESTWGFAGYCGEAGGRLTKKPVSKGGQTTIAIDIHHRYPRAYVHRHSLQTARTRPAGFGQQGPAEVVWLMKQLDQLIVDRADDSNVEIMDRAKGVKPYSVPKKQIFDSPPHFTADNHFSGEHVMDYVGSQGYGITCTTRRDRLPTELKKYLHHEKKDSNDARMKVMRFENPICVTKYVAATATTKAYTKNLVSFQSTGSTNISGVNNLPSLKLYVAKRNRGRGKLKRTWGIEMNEAREIYLNHYSGVDSLDHMIKNAGIKYITHKYWHSPYLHALSLAVIAAYDMYNECCDGELDASWKIDVKDRMSFAEFRLKLSGQMLQYNPLENKYAGDITFRDFSQSNRSRRSNGSQATVETFPDTGVTMDNMAIARMVGRFCDPTQAIRVHFQHIFKTNNPSYCEVCGEKCYYKCRLCNKTMCVMPGKRWEGARCAFMYHSEEFFGLSRSDYKDVQGKSDIKNWKPASEKVIKRNARYIARMKASAAEGGRVDGAVVQSSEAV